MEEINSYLDTSAVILVGSFTSAQEKGRSIYNHAQLLAAVGKYGEAVEYYEQSYTILKKFIPDPVYRQLFCSVGFQYATTLDYLGKYDKAGDVFALIMEVNPTGIHIGDYALYLHRRKREFDKAQKYVIYSKYFVQNVVHV